MNISSWRYKNERLWWLRVLIITTSHYRIIITKSYCQLSIFCVIYNRGFNDLTDYILIPSHVFCTWRYVFFFVEYLIAKLNQLMPYCLMGDPLSRATADSSLWRRNVSFSNNVIAVGNIRIQKYTVSSTLVQ